MTLYTDNRYLEGAREKLGGRAEVLLATDFTPVFARLAVTGARTLGYHAETTLVPELRELEKSGLELVDVTGEIERCMAVKRPAELGSIGMACAIAERVYVEILDFLEEGVTERAVANEMEYRFRKYGASDRSFETIAAFGGNAAVPHHECSNRALREGDAVLLDFGCVFEGYCSDMTRTVVFGKPDPEFERAYEAVLASHEAAVSGIRAGMTGKEADAIARNALAERGLAQYFTHSLGHGVGVNIHEFPRLSPKSEAVLADGMVFSIEPGVYLPGKFGIRIEDTVTLSDGRVRSFMKQPKALLSVCGKKRTQK